MDHEDQREYVGEIIGTCYALIAKLLGSLTPPIMLPVPNPGHLRETRQAVINTRNLIADLPLEPIARAMLDTILLEWLTALTLAMHERRDASGQWALDAAVAATTRLTLIAEHFAIEIGLFDQD